MIYLVFSTISNLTIGRKIVNILLKKRLAACGHLTSLGESHYWWNGKREKTKEVMLLLKTSKKALKPLLQTLKEVHPYETPEILAVRVDHGYLPYLKWVESETRV